MLKKLPHQNILENRGWGRISCKGTTLRSVLEQEIRAYIREQGRITFAQFMQACLYSPRGGFYAARQQRIGIHFGTSPTSHPAFGALIARQLKQMWHRLDDPPVFHVIEVGAGDGALARSVVHACGQLTPAFAQAIRYVAADYQPYWDQSSAQRVGPGNGNASIQRVKTGGLRAFRNVVGCILSNELIDNFPVHRFAIQGGRIKEVFVTLSDEHFVEVLDSPSSARIEYRLTNLGLTLAEGYRSEVNLAMEDWVKEAARALERGFILTIDYGQQAAELYAPENNQGTLVCYHEHAVLDDPYQNIGQQDITCHVDFTTLMQLGEQHGLSTVGYIPQHQFLENLGFSSLLNALDAQGLSAARTALSRMAMMSLVDTEQYGDLKVLAQAKGPGLDGALAGFVSE